MSSSKNKPNNLDQIQLPENIIIVDPEGNQVKIPDGYIAILQPDGKYTLVKFPG
jgi:hypothetical protein